MSLVKKDIRLNIQSKAQISSKHSQLFIESFINILKSNLASKSIKISSFGTFSQTKTPQRIGRNPKTKEEYTIKSFKRIKFMSSGKIKKLLN